MMMILEQRRGPRSRHRMAQGSLGRTDGRFGTKDPSNGLCNGTRLLARRIINNRLLEAVIAGTDRVVLIHRGRKLADDSVSAFRERAGGRTRGRIEVGAGGTDRVGEVFARLGLEAPTLSIDDQGHAVFSHEGPDRSELLGRAFAEAGLVVLELHHDRAGLEAVFLGLLDQEAGSP